MFTGFRMICSRIYGFLKTNLNLQVIQHIYRVSDDMLKDLWVSQNQSESSGKMFLIADLNFLMHSGDCVLISFSIQGFEGFHVLFHLLTSAQWSCILYCYQIIQYNFVTFWPKLNINLVENYLKNVVDI